MKLSKITTKGQVTIPLKLRKLMGVRPGDKIVFESESDGKVMIKKVDSRVSLAGVLKTQVSKAATDKEINTAVRHGWRNSGGN